MNQCVWFDIPVQDLARASKFYSEVLATEVEAFNEFPGLTMAVFKHKEGTSGCLVLDKNNEPSPKGPLLYLNVNGRIGNAQSLVERLGGKVLAPLFPLGRFGYCVVCLDSEGNRIALHSETEK